MSLTENIRNVYLFAKTISNSSESFVLWLVDCLHRYTAAMEQFTS